MHLTEAIQQSGLSLRRLGAKLDHQLSAAALSRLCNYGEWPVRHPRPKVQRSLEAALSAEGVDIASIRWPEQGVRPGYGLATRRQATVGEPIHRHQPQLTREDIDLMQVDQEVLRLFGLTRNPFENDTESDADIYRSRSYDSAIRAINEAIKNRGFLAVTAPSGAGKTTIWEGVEGTCALRSDVVVCRPYLKHKEVLSPGHLAKCLLLGTQGPDFKVARDAEDCGRQLSVALRGEAEQGRTPVLYIDDAHFATTSVLRQLKTFYEEKVGRLRLMSIILVGLPELRNKLAAFAEIGNRCRVIEIQPVPVKEYLEHKLKRVNSSLDRLFDQGGKDALFERFRAERGNAKLALGYPLAINTTVIRAMVRWSQNGAQVGERMTSELVDSLPGAPARKERA